MLESTKFYCRILLGLHIPLTCSISFGQVHIKHEKTQVLSPNSYNNRYNSANTGSGETCSAGATIRRLPRALGQKGLQKRN